MHSIKNSRSKALYKTFIRLKETKIIQQKIFKFRRKKWKKFVEFLERDIKRREISHKLNKRPRDYICYASTKYFIPTYCNRFKNIFRESLINKQRLKFLYGFFPQKQLKTIVNKPKMAGYHPITPPVKLFQQLEYRLDVILYRAFFVKSPRQAKQLIHHRQVLINGLIAANSRVIVKLGDFIEIVPYRHKFIKENVYKLYTWPLEPKYLTINYGTLQICFTKNIKDINLSRQYNAWINYYNLINFYKY